MNTQAIRILFLKDLFLSRHYLFAYMAAGILATFLALTNNETLSFIGFILIITVAIATGIHMLGMLMLGESIEQTRIFVMSLPVSLLEYSLSKLLVVLVTYLIPWCSMFALTAIGTVVLPWAERGSLAVLPTIFGFLLVSFVVQLVVAIVSESVGWTIAVMVVGNVGLNVFLMKFMAIPEVKAVANSEVLSWPWPIVAAILTEAAIVLVALGLAFAFQTRKRDII